MEKDILKKCYEKAIKVIELCSTPNGLYASAGPKGYNAVWARDSMISMIGASVCNNSFFKEVFKNSIITLAENQGKTGQIANCVDKWEDRKPHVDFQTIDSTLWFIIGNYVYRDRYNDDSLMKKYKSNIEKAIYWLRCQDIGENNMLAQLPTTDWQDAFPHKYGYTINTQALFYKVLNLIWDEDSAIKLKKTVNEDEDKSLWNGNYYVPYRWKNHNKYQEIGDWFDSLGNFLAIVYDLADKEHANKILSYVKSKKIDTPYPVRAIFPPITRKHRDWKDYYMDCEAGKPNSYLNGGIWGYIGGFYILSLIKCNRLRDAESSLYKLAERNLSGNFPEWTHPKTRKHYGLLQAWEAGMYILAYESLDEEKVLL
ncbi:MAG: amylo-alpha-1,6-glucosidase [Candidatus Pacearchaeota archaeon]